MAAPPPGSDWVQIQQWMDQNQGAFTSWLAQQPADRQQQIVSWLQTDNPLSDVGRALDDPNTETPLKSYITDYLSQLPKDQQQFQVGHLSVEPQADPGAAPAASSADTTGMNDLLTSLGVSYPNGPSPTPALLAFLKGLGLNLQTAQDVQKRAIDRIGLATDQAMQDIDRSAGRTKQNITGDLVRRGVLSSGEANTRYARQTEDVGVSRRDLERTKAAGTSDAQVAYNQTTDVARMQALDRLIATEQDQATQKASSQATQDAYQRQLDLLDRQNQQETTARTDYLNQIKDLYGQAGAAGVAV